MYPCELSVVSFYCNIASSPDLRICQGLLDRVSHWYSHVYNLLEMLILPPTEVGTGEIPQSGDYSLTGIELDFIYESC